MAEAWERELDRRKMDPEYRDEYQKDLDRQCEAGRQMEEYYTKRCVVTDFTHTTFKPGMRVKYMDQDNDCKEGVVVGATSVSAIPDLLYVLLADNKIVEVEEIDLVHGWDRPKPQDTAETPTEPTPNDDIPF